MADVLIRNEDSVTLLTPKSEASKVWINENLNLEPWQWMGNSCAIEQRYASDIIQGMQEDGLDAVPETEVTASKKTSATSAPVQSTPQPIIQPIIQPPAPVAPVEEPQTNEKRTIPSELPNALFHMATDEDKPKYTVEDAEREYTGYKAQHPEYQVDDDDDEDLKDEYRNLTSASEFLQTAWNESTKNAVSHGYMAGALDALRWAKRITIKDYSKGYDTYVYGIGSYIQKEARGGWHRISQYTIASDDKRFTITLIDATRRSKWFLLKDIETGISYEKSTMTDAKKTAIQLRDVDVAYNVNSEVEKPQEDLPEEIKEAGVSSSFTNGLLGKNHNSVKNNEF